MTPTAAKPRRPMGRRRQPPPPKQPGDEWHVKLARLVNQRKGDRTDAEIASAADVSPTYFSRILRGDAPQATVQTLLDILDVLGASMCDLDEA